MRMITKTTIIAIGILVASGCATIVGQKTQTIGINSTPNKAKVTVIDEKQVTVFEGNTPVDVLLNKSDGSYFGGKTYVVKIDKAGYQPVEVTVNSGANGWYILGNLVFGGIIGWLIVDPLSGAMYNLSPEKIDTQLPQRESNSGLTPNSISVVLLENVPESLRGQMVRIK